MGSRETGPDGSYTLSLPSGTYIVKACPNCSRVDDYLDQWYGGGSSPHRRDASLISLTAPGITANINFVLSVGGSISWWVRKTDGRTPIDNLHVFAKDYQTDVRIAGTETGRNGSYTLNLPTGTYVVKSCPGCSRQGLFVAEWYDDVVGRNEATPVRVTASESSPNINFNLKVDATISGRVVDGQTGLPISGMEVRARLNKRDVSETRTGSDGAYNLQGVPDGEIEVAVFGQGYVEQRRNVSVRDGENILGVDF